MKNNILHVSSGFFFIFIIFFAIQHTNAAEFKYAGASDFPINCDDASKLDREGKFFCAVEQAKQCGFDFSRFRQEMDEYIGIPHASTLSLYFVETLNASYGDDCQKAAWFVHSIGDAKQRTAIENEFMVLLSLYGIGLLVDKTSDRDHDGSYDSQFNACSPSTFDYQYAWGVSVLFWDLHKSLGELIQFPFYTLFHNLTSHICTGLDALAQDLCSTEDPWKFDEKNILAARSLLREGAAFGLDQCGGGQSLATCHCE